MRDQIKELQADIEDMLSTDITDPFKLALYNNMASEKLDIMIAAIRQMKACEKRIANMDKEIKDDITDDMIGRAKQYPIDQLIKFERGKATAWCHDDKHPSLSHDRKRNRARCFPCDKSFDSIAVLVDRDGMGFKEAVKWLAGN